MPKKLTIEEFINKAKQVHGNKYDYSKVEYKNSSTKVCITCPKHGVFWLKPNDHLMGHGCPLCKSDKSRERFSLTTELFIEKAKSVHGDKYDYSKVLYISGKSTITIICPIHGEFQQTPHDHLAGNGCLKCGIEHRIKLVTKSQEDFIKESLIVHKCKYDYSEVNYKNTYTKVKIICPIHGVFEQTPHQHLQGAGCPKCVGRNQTTEDFIIKAKSIHGDKYDYSKVKYIDTRTPVIIICREHGEFYLTPGAHLQGKGCSKCTLKSLKKVFDQLSNCFNTKILFEVGKTTLPWLKNYRLDMYMPEYNIAIEYDGIQHFKPVEYWGGEKALSKTQIRDCIKELLCENYGCLLFRISYNYTETDFNKLVNNIKNVIKKNGQIK